MLDWLYHLAASHTKLWKFYMADNVYCLSEKVHISKSHFSETPQEKYDHVIFLQPKSSKKCHKNLKIGSLVK